MLTLKSFKALTESYGAEPERWPDSMRADAEALLRVSPQAQRLLAEARALDEVIDAASERDATARWAPGEEAATLTRLRAVVESRGVRPAGQETAAGWRHWLLGWMLPVAQWPSSVRLAGMAVAGGFIIAVGLFLGSMDAPRPAPQVDVLAMLQPDPLPFLADQ